MKLNLNLQAFSSESEDQYQQIPMTTNKLINILKHIPVARKILQGHNYEKQYIHCKYDQELNSLPNFIMPKNNGSEKICPPLSSRLISLQAATFEHNNMKDKINSMLGHKNDYEPEFIGTLWSLYSGKQPVYSRFGSKIKKNNFANNLMQINDVNIQIGPRFRPQKLASIQQEPKFMSSESVRFQSHFQSGNLLYAYRADNQDLETYDLILQNDINTRGHNQWFFFKIINTRKFNKIRINIINLIKQQSMFSYGIKPLVLSQRDYNNLKVSWCHSGQKISYNSNKIKRENNPKKLYYTLSFEYYFKQCDSVYFAPSYPYTYTQLLAYQDTLMHQNAYNNTISIKPIVQTVGANKINVVTISTGKRQIQNCKIVWILARQHPGETIGSFMAEGMIDYLFGLFNAHNQQKQKQNKVLDSLIFKIIPMINIDGVIHGNTRANITGVDPNRMWKKSIRRLCPQISAIKKLILSSKQNIQMILDLHSHSKKLGCFFYGNTIRHNPKSTKLFPSLVCQADKKQRFTIKNCRYRGGYSSTARNVLFQKLQKQKIYTIECSMLGYLKKNRIVQYTVADYHEMGKIILQTYINLQNSKISKSQSQIMDDMSDKACFDYIDIESARSESNLSDQQYEQIRLKIKKKNPKQIKNSNNNENSANPPKKIFDISKVKKSVAKTDGKNNTSHFRGQSAGGFKSPRGAAVVPQKIQNSKRLYDISLNIYIKQSDKKNQGQEKLQKKILQQSSNIQQKSLPMKIPKITNFTKPKNNSTSKNNQNSGSYAQGPLTPAINKSLSYKQKQRTRTESNFVNKIKINDKKLTIIQQDKEKVNVQIQVNQEQLVNQRLDLPHHRISLRDRIRNKNDDHQDKLLCIVGNSLEDQFTEVYKNQVGAQVTPEIISIGGTALSKRIDLNILQKSNKIPKILNSFCQNTSMVDEQSPIMNTHIRKLNPITLKKTISKC